MSRHVSHKSRGGALTRPTGPRGGTACVPLLRDAGTEDPHEKG